MPSSEARAETPRIHFLYLARAYQMEVVGLDRWLSLHNNLHTRLSSTVVPK